MEQKAKSILVMTIALAVLALAGFVGVSYAVSSNDAAVTRYPNDRANHHSLHEAN